MFLGIQEKELRSLSREKVHFLAKKNTKKDLTVKTDLVVSPTWLTTTYKETAIQHLTWSRGEIKTFKMS